MTNSSTTPNILITGATGTVGAELVKQLTAAGVAFKAMVRTNTASSQFAGNKFATTVIADLNVPETLSLALNGIEKVFLLTNSTELAETQQKNLVAAAVDAGVKHIVKLSQFAADLHSPVRFLRYHAAVTLSCDRTFLCKACYHLATRSNTKTNFLRLRELPL